MIAPAFAEHNIAVVVASSDKYAPFAGVFLKSLINHANPQKNYDIIVFEREISEGNKELLKSLAAESNNISIRIINPIQLISIGQEPLSMGNERFPMEVYFKIIAPHVLPEYKRLLIVDVDTLLLRDIADLFETDLDEYCIGAVPCPLWQGHYARNDVFGNIHIQEYCRDVLHMDNPLMHANTGMILFDTEKYCRVVSLEELISAAQSREFILQDECVLNMLYEHKIKFLNPAWNFCLPVSPPYKVIIEEYPHEESSRAYREASKDPYLLHWAANPKPWECPDVIYGSDWWQVALQTPFVGAILSRMVDYMIHRNEYYKNNKYNRIPDLWSTNPLRLDPNRHKNKNLS